MLKIQENTKEQDSLISPVEIEVEMFDEDCRRGSLVFPSIENINDKNSKPTIHYDVVGDISNISVESCRIELDQMLRHFDRFKDSPTYLVRVSSMYSMCGEHDRAISYAEKAFEKKNSDALKYNLASTALKYRKFKQAQDLFASLADKNNISALLRMAEISISNDDLDAAKKIVSKALNYNIIDWRVHLLAGAIELMDGNYADSIKYYRVALSEKINSPSVYINMSIAYYLLGNKSKAISHVKKSLNLNPLNKLALALLTDISFSEVSYLDSAEKYINKYLRYMPTSNTFVERLGKIYLLKNETDKGLALFDKSKKFYNDAGMFNNYGVFWAKKNKLTVAGQYFSQAIEKVGGIQYACKDRATEIAVLNLSRVYTDLKHFTYSLEIIRAFLSSSSRDYYNDEVISDIYNVEIKNFIAIGDYNEAVKLAEILAFKEDAYIPVRVDAYIFLASYCALITNELSGSLDNAIKGYELSKTYSGLDPVKRSMILNNLIYSYLELGNLEKAKNYIDLLMFDTQNIEYIYATLGLYHLRKGDCEKGCKSYMKAISLAKQKERKQLFSQKFNYELGKYWYKNNNIKNSLKHLKKSIKYKSITDNWKISLIYEQARDLIAEIKNNK